MNGIKMLKAQKNLALTMIDKRAIPGIVNYIEELEKQAKILAHTWAIIRAEGLEIVLEQGDPEGVDFVAENIMEVTK